jgi:putative transposase
MPEHVHLLMWPTRSDTTVDDLSWFLAAVKRPFSAQVKEHLESTGRNLLKRLTIRTRPGKTAFRFWQEGPGYDRNLQTEKSVTASIDYIHHNPVTRKLVQNIAQWRWSSARWYLSERSLIDRDLPLIHGPPSVLYDGTS